MFNFAYDLKINVGLLKIFLLHETHSNPTEFWLDPTTMMWSTSICTSKTLHEQRY